MRKKSQFKNMVKSKGLSEPMTFNKGEPCPMCGVDEWGNILFCTCPLTKEQLETIKPKGFY